ncbi:MAG: adenylate/guanylate cyclase domain-containing protein [Nitrospirae bacterium]|nr:adenylate/guanylate cyclase domain-containing protein [Nitrospirota bacterium]
MSERTGTILFFDLAGFSTNSNPTQVKIAESFFAEVKRLTSTVKSGRPDAGKYSVLPTGDGAAIIIWKGKSDAIKSEHAALSIASEMMVWADRHKPKIGIRCGINQGILDLIKDPNGQTNVCGAAINVAQRVMDAANSGQILLHHDNFAKHIESHYESSNNNLSYNLDSMSYEILAKHNEILRVNTVTGKIKINGRKYPFGKSGAPANKWHLQIEPPILSLNKYGIKDKKTPPEKLLKKHKKIACVGATNDQLPEIILKVLKNNPSKIWDSIMVYFLKDKTFKWMDMKSDGRSHSELIEAKKDAIKCLASVLKGHVKHLEFREYDRPFYFASYWDWDAPGGRIHISPYIWGADVRHCPAFDYTWITNQPTPQYLAYRNGLEQLRSLSKLIVPEKL